MTQPADEGRPGEQLDAAAVLAWYRARYGDDVWRVAIAEVTNDVLRRRITELQSVASSTPGTPDTAMSPGTTPDPSRRET